MMDYIYSRMSLPRSFTVWVSLCVAFGGAVGCTKTQVDVGAPWDVKEAAFFDDGMDFVKDPESLSGEWAFRHRNLLEGRIQLADSVAVVEVKTVQTKTDVEGREVKRIDVSIAEQLYGKNPENDISLESAETSPGYQLILRHERHLSGRWLLFARWFKDDDTASPAVGHHFHLSPATDANLSKIGPRIRRRIEEEEKDAEQGDE